MTDKKRLPRIQYTSRDFDSIKRDLNDHRKRYYSHISRDENEASFDDLMIDTVSYVGDILSFYVDYGVNESFLDTAIEYNNIIRHGKATGYKFSGVPSSVGEITLYCIVPANANGLGPDSTYLFKLKRNSQFGPVAFLLTEDVDFANPTNEVVVARVNESNGLPTAYAIRAKGKIISGKIVEEYIDIGDFKKFLKIELGGKNISEILSVVDADGNEYFEVDNLSQDVVYKAIANSNADKFSTPYYLRPIVVPRRFIVDREQSKTFLQFGYGSDVDTSNVDPIIDPSTVVLDVFGKDYISDVSFDPSNLLETDKFGIAPANTRLRIIYRVNTADNVNAGPGGVSEVVNPLVEFTNGNTLNVDVMRSIIDSLECLNEVSIVGDVSFPSIQELKMRIFGSYASQNRAVTTPDYKTYVYAMPKKFGAVKRVNVAQDTNSFKRNLNVYVVSENTDGTLVASNNTLKDNIKNWLNAGRMINDSIDILDAKIVNIGIDFIIAADLEAKKYEIRERALLTLRKKYLVHQDIGLPFSINDVFKTLHKVEGVVDVLKVKIFTKVGGDYSSITFNIDDFITNDGRYIEVPQNVILEIKRPLVDIRGSVK